MLIALTSASGSPGVTTTALGLAYSWPRPVILIDADPTGSASIPAGFFRGASLPPLTLLDLSLANSDGHVAEVLSLCQIPLPGSDTASFVRGVLSHQQARGLSTLWGPLTSVCKSLEHSANTDVIIDCGRLGLDGFAGVVPSVADLTLLTMRATMPAFFGAQSWAESLKNSLGIDHRLGLLVIGPNRPYPSRDLSAALGIRTVTEVEWAPDLARVLSEGEKATKRFDRSTYLRGLATSAHTISDAISKAREQLGTTDQEIKL